jgi:NitT/TauT family transport system substrate-binding protein
VNEEIKKETSKALAAEVLDDAFGRMDVTYDPLREPLAKSAQQAFQLGFLGKEPPDLSGLFDVSLLNEVLREKKVGPVQ